MEKNECGIDQVKQCLTKRGNKERRPEQIDIQGMMNEIGYHTKGIKTSTCLKKLWKRHSQLKCDNYEIDSPPHYVTRGNRLAYLQVTDDEYNTQDV